MNGCSTCDDRHDTAIKKSGCCEGSNREPPWSGDSRKGGSSQDLKEEQESWKRRLRRTFQTEVQRPEGEEDAAPSRKGVACLYSSQGEKRWG